MKPIIVPYPGGFSVKDYSREIVNLPGWTQDQMDQVGDLINRVWTAGRQDGYADGYDAVAREVDNA